MKKVLIALTLSGLVVFGFFVSRSTYKEIKRNRQIQDEIKTLEKEAETLKKNNQNLKEKIAYFETKDFQELEAKRELSFQKPDENVVIVKPSTSQMMEEIPNQSVQGINQSKMVTPNYLKWFKLFFE
jgi:cell division protein FtsB